MFLVFLDYSSLNRERRIRLEIKALEVPRVVLPEKEPQRDNSNQILSMDYLSRGVERNRIHELND